MLEEIMTIVIIVMLVIIWTVGWIRERNEKYENFNKQLPVGFIFYTNLKKQKFPYGKWKYLGKNVDGSHLYERVK